MKRKLAMGVVCAGVVALATSVQAANIVWDGTTDNNWTNGPQDNSGGGYPANGSTGANWTIDAGTSGQVAPPDATTPGSNTIDYLFSGHSWTISGATINEDVQIKLNGGMLNVNNSNISLLPSSANTGAGLSGLNLGQTNPTTATISNSTLNVSRSNFGGRAIGVLNGSSLSLVNTAVNLTAENGLGKIDVNHPNSSLTIDANSSITATGAVEVLHNTGLLTLQGGSIHADHIRLNVSGGTSNDLVFDFQGGTVTVTSNNPFRGSAFEGSFDWTGGVGSGSVIATDSNTITSNLAKKVSQGFFSIDGVRVNPTTDSAVDGLAALQAELPTLTVGGKWFNLADNGSGTQTLTLVPEPASLALLGIGVLMLARRSRQCYNVS